MHRFIVLFVGCLVVAWLVSWWFYCAIVFVVLGDARPFGVAFSDKICLKREP